ncbi:PilZ domain-containing protein [Geoalkalibacter sp.]|uniref:PilZ domain-containing protein n=1 Tax=Geoalkalibacter sp. TaxID=3041440 RepID=UPI00272DE498|nr:PilZ domain-containing protein [Geoalkalibacter sp.]
MSRKFIIIDHSPALRKIIGAKIRANLDDVQVLEAETPERGLALLQDHRCHLIIHLWDGFDVHALSLFDKLREMPADRQIPFLLLTSNESEESLRLIAEKGIPEHLLLPCPSRQFAETLNRVCNPVSLRRDKRYAVQDTIFLLEQRGHALQGNVINASLGGMLCELPFSENFNWSLPASASINFFVDGKNFVAPHLYSSVVQLTVTHRHPDFSPRKLRVSFRFLQIPEESRLALQQVFSLMEAMEQTSTYLPVAATLG